MKNSTIEILLGKTLKTINKSFDNRAIIFVCVDDKKYLMTHFEECCEVVYIEDICGDLQDLLNNPILLAEKVYKENDEETESWTFYKLSTIKGSVSIRWYGSTSSEYSIAVNFYLLESDDKLIESYLFDEV